MMQQPAQSARKAGGSARPRRAVQSKGPCHCCCSLRNLVIFAVVAWTFFLCLDFPAISDTAELSNGGGDPCRGRYIYVHDLPSRFNTDMIRDCRKAGGRWGDMCAFLSNAGLGRPLTDVDGGEAGWYDTHELALDAIFHSRMKQYECLTNRSAAAAAVFVPFYAGFDALRYQVGYDRATRDAASADLSFWLTVHPQWNRMAGRDHFLVAGRTGWDFRRRSGGGGGAGGDARADRRGNGLLLTPAGRNMSLLVLESTLEHGTDFSVPYPTYFHPRSDADVLRWQDRVRGHHRTRLMAFVGAPRPDVPIPTVRDRVIAQCKASSACTMLSCARTGSTQCHRSPGDIMRLFQEATFCLQPPADGDGDGDGDDSRLTRRSVFDSMVAGCIPVFFHAASAYKQYPWHLPKDDHLKHSVFIPDADVARRNVSIEAVLRAIPPATMERMREEVIRLIPRLLYADPRTKLETIKDAVDVAIEGVLDTVARIKNGEQVNCGGPVDKDPPNLFAATASRISANESVPAVEQHR